MDEFKIEVIDYSPTEQGGHRTAILKWRDEEGSKTHPSCCLAFTGPTGLAIWEELNAKVTEILRG
jgi:hypothetical protein